MRLAAGIGCNSRGKPFFAKPFCCSLILTSRSLTDASNAAQKLMERFNPESDPDGVQAFALALDVRGYKAVAVVADIAIKWKEHVDIVINKWQDCPCAFGTDWLFVCSAGGSPGAGGGLFDREVADIEELIQLNLMGTMWVCKAFGLHMASLVDHAHQHTNPSPKIINIASIAGLVGRDSNMYDNLGMS